jgi:hypothetical protein
VRDEETGSADESAGQTGGEPAAAGEPGAPTGQPGAAPAGSGPGAAPETPAAGAGTPATPATPAAAAAGGAGADAPDTDDDDDDLFWAQPTPRDPAFGFWVVLAGLVAIVIVFVVAEAVHGGNSNFRGIVTIISPAFAAIAGLVGAYFGLRAGTLAARHVADSVKPHHASAPPARGRKHFAHASEPTVKDLTQVWLEARHRRRQRVKQTKNAGRP